MIALHVKAYLDIPWITIHPIYHSYIGTLWHLSQDCYDSLKTSKLSNYNILHDQLVLGVLHVSYSISYILHVSYSISYILHASYSISYILHVSYSISHILHVPYSISYILYVSYSISYILHVSYSISYILHVSYSISYILHVPYSISYILHVIQYIKNGWLPEKYGVLIRLITLKVALQRWFLS